MKRTRSDVDDEPEDVDPILDLMVRNMQYDRAANWRARALLNHADSFREYAELLGSKVRISTLASVLNALNEEFPLKDLFGDGFASFQNQCKKNYEFTFESKVWWATVKHATSYKKGETRRCISLKVPNDGFVYTSKYQAPDSKVDLDLTDSEAGNEVGLDFLYVVLGCMPKTSTRSHAIMR